MVNNSPKFITEASQFINRKHGLPKAINFLSKVTTGLNPVELFGVCDGKAYLDKDLNGRVVVKWNPEEYEDTL